MVPSPWFFSSSRSRMTASTILTTDVHMLLVPCRHSSTDSAPAIVSAVDRDTGLARVAAACMSLYGRSGRTTGGGGCGPSSMCRSAPRWSPPSDAGPSGPGEAPTSSSNPCCGLGRARPRSSIPGNEVIGNGSTAWIGWSVTRGVLTDLSAGERASSSRREASADAPRPLDPDGVSTLLGPKGGGAS